MVNIVLDDPVVKKFVKHFRWSDVDGGVLISYDGVDFETVCRVVGCLFMGVDPCFYLDVSQSVVNVVLGLYNLPVDERLLVVELFDYFECECSRKVLKRVLGDGVS